MDKIKARRCLFEMNDQCLFCVRTCSIWTKYLRDASLKRVRINKEKWISPRNYNLYWSLNGEKIKWSSKKRLCGLLEQGMDDMKIILKLKHPSKIITSVEFEHYSSIPSSGWVNNVLESELTLHIK